MANYHLYRIKKLPSPSWLLVYGNEYQVDESQVAILPSQGDANFHNLSTKKFIMLFATQPSA